MSQPVTKDDLRVATREIIDHFNKSQSEQNQQLGAIAEDVAKIKLAVIDLLATDRHLHNLVAALQRQGIKLSETEVFST